MQIEQITYTQLERLLARLGYQQVPSEPGTRVFVNAEYDAVSVLPAASGEELARAHHLITLHKVATERGIVDEATFGKLLAEASQQPSELLAKAS